MKRLREKKGEILGVLVATKLDLEALRAVSRDEYIEFAKSIGWPIVETSAYKNSNIREVFECLGAPA